MTENIIIIYGVLYNVFFTLNIIVLMTQLILVCKLEVIVNLINYKGNTCTSIQCGQLLSMSMDSACYTIMYNDNSVMYYEPMHALY